MSTACGTGMSFSVGGSGGGKECGFERNSGPWWGCGDKARLARVMETRDKRRRI
jgi:hypothetical protein